jgi:hypothetical protein
MAVQADYVWKGSRELMFIRNHNVTYDPATGVNISRLGSQPADDY